MYADRHDQALADCSRAIELNPNDAGHWRRRAHAYTIAPTPQPERGIEDATRAIELDPDHSMGYAHRAIAYTCLPTPEWATPSPTSTGTSNCLEGTTPRRTECAPGSTRTTGTTGKPSGTYGWPDDGTLPSKSPPSRK